MWGYASDARLLAVLLGKNSFLVSLIWAVGMKQALLLGALGLHFLRVWAQGYQDIAPALGVFHSYGIGYFGGGVSWADFDGDGDDDLSLASQASYDLAFYRNDGGSLSRVTLTGIRFSAATGQLLWCDYDNDGDADLLATASDAPSRLYRNDGTLGFTDVTAAAGLPGLAMPTYAACWGDYDRDGWLDLYLTVRAPGPPGPWRNYLLRNQGDGTFVDRTIWAGVEDLSTAPLAVVFADLDGDLFPEIYIAQDKYVGNTLFRNNGDGTFANRSQVSGAGIAMDGMGIATGDYDQDGDLDLYVANSPPGNPLLRNEGNLTFTDQAGPAGVAHYGNCWGVNFFDADLDGRLDLYVSAKNITNTFEPTSTLFMQQAAGDFVAHLLPGDTAIGYGNAVGDLDGDGHYEIAVNNVVPYMAQIWRQPPGPHHWLKVRLRGTVSNRDGVGAWIELWAGGQRQVRYTQCGTSYMGQNSFDELFGLGTLTTVDSVRVRWPSGLVDRHRGLAVDQRVVLVEGQVATPTGLPAPWQGPALSLRVGEGGTYLHAATALPQPATVTVLDLHGRQVWQQAWTGTAALRLPDGLAAGSYVLRVQGHDGSQWIGRW